MNRLGATVLVACFACIAACQSPRRGSFDAGERALHEGRLADALCIFDSVPVFDLRYPEARVQAAGLERRLRQHKELLLAALELRSEWRDREALTTFGLALEHWPEHRETRALLDATEGRLRVLESLRDSSAGSAGYGDDETAGAEQDLVAGPTAAGRTRPGRALPSRVLPSRASPSRASPEAGAKPMAMPSGETGSAVGAPETRSSAAGSAQESVPGKDLVAAELSQLVAASSAGDIENVLQRLVHLHRSWPEDPRVTVWLARMFQQRGLMAYGNGDVPAAVRDWQRALDLDPELRAARLLLDLARKELTPR